VDFLTSAGHLEGGDARKRMGFPGKGPTAVITDLGILAPDPVTKELTLTSIHPGVEVKQVIESTGWTLKVSPKLTTTEPPAAEELRVLRELNERTARAHAGQA
jgi:glutaconate CoA-transferase subunit B